MRRGSEHPVNQGHGQYVASSAEWQRCGPRFEVWRASNTHRAQLRCAAYTSSPTRMPLASKKACNGKATSSQHRASNGPPGWDSLAAVWKLCFLASSNAQDSLSRQGPPSANDSTVHHLHVPLLPVVPSLCLWRPPCLLQALTRRPHPFPPSLAPLPPTAIPLHVPSASQLVCACHHGLEASFPGSQR